MISVSSSPSFRLLPSFQPPPSNCMHTHTRRRGSMATPPCGVVCGRALPAPTQNTERPSASASAAVCFCWICWRPKPKAKQHTRSRPTRCPERCITLAPQQGTRTRQRIGRQPPTANRTQARRPPRHTDRSLAGDTAGPVRVIISQRTSQHGCRMLPLGHVQPRVAVVHHPRLGVHRRLPPSRQRRRPRRCIQRRIIPNFRRRLLSG
jgi:hypothetical protein